MMIFFGSRGQRSSADSAEGVFLQSRWFRTLLTFCSVLVVIAVCIEIYRRANNYGAQKVVERIRYPVEAAASKSKIPGLAGNRRIVTSLLDEIVCLCPEAMRPPITAPAIFSTTMFFTMSPISTPAPT